MKKNIVVALLVACVVVVGFSAAVEARGGSRGNREYSWTPQTPEEKVFELLREGPSAYIDGSGWAILAIHIPLNVQEIEVISPELKGKLLKHAEAMLEQLKKSEDQYEVEKMANALIFYQQKIDFKDNYSIKALARVRSVIAGKKAIADLTVNCVEFHECVEKGKDCNTTEINRERSNILYGINGTLQYGVTLNEIGVASVESMRDRAECRE